MYSIITVMVVVSGVRHRDDEGERIVRVYPSQGRPQRAGALCSSTGAGAGPQRRTDTAGR